LISVNDWLRRPKEVVNSKTRPGFVDIPENAAKWLLHFKSQNQALIKELDVSRQNSTSLENKIRIYNILIIGRITTVSMNGNGNSSLHVIPLLF